MTVSTAEVTFEDLSDRDASVTYSSFSTREIFESYSRLRAFLFSSEMIRVITSMTACTILIAMSCSTSVRACNRVSTSKFLLWDLDNVTWEVNDMIERDTESENSKKKPERWEKADDRMMILLYHAKVLKYTLAWTFSVILRTPVLTAPTWKQHQMKRKHHPYYQRTKTSSGSWRVYMSNHTDLKIFDFFFNEVIDTLLKMEIGVIFIFTFLVCRFLVTPVTSCICVVCRRNPSPVRVLTTSQAFLHRFTFHLPTANYDTSVCPDKSQEADQPNVPLVFEATVRMLVCGWCKIPPVLSWATEVSTGMSSVFGMKVRRKYHLLDIAPVEQSASSV